MIDLRWQLNVIFNQINFDRRVEPGWIYLVVGAPRSYFVTFSVVSGPHLPRLQLSLSSLQLGDELSSSQESLLMNLSCLSEQFLEPARFITSNDWKFSKQWNWLFNILYSVR